MELPVSYNSLGYNQAEILEWREKNPSSLTLESLLKIQWIWSTEISSENFSFQPAKKAVEKC